VGAELAGDVLPRPDPVGPQRQGEGGAWHLGAAPVSTDGSPGWSHGDLRAAHSPLFLVRPSPTRGTAAGHQRAGVRSRGSSRVITLSGSPPRRGPARASQTPANAITVAPATTGRSSDPANRRGSTSVAPWSPAQAACTSGPSSA